MKGAPKILDANGIEIGVGDKLESVTLDWGPLVVTGFSTLTSNESGATLFVVADDGEEMPWALQVSGDGYRSHSLKLFTKPDTGGEQDG